MPHSTSPETPIAEPPSQQTMAEPSTNPVDSQTAEDADVDMDEGPQREQQPIVKNEEDKKEMKLDDLFADVDSDEEFPSTKPKAEEEDYLSDSPDIEDALGTNGLSGAKASDPEVMRMFYQRLFPWRYLFQWLNHSPTPSDDFKHREFAFTLQNDAYLRYQSFATSDLLRKDVLRLLPSRFEIGPVYTTNPRERKTMRNSSAFKPLSKELCFDIDLTDYDDIRTCCDKANICNKCWQFITMAIAVVDTALRDDFGFEHIMWVYSGRRGAHAWVCDKKARGLDDQKRRGIAGYLEILRGGAQSGKKVNLRRPLHPHVSRSLDLLKSHFQSDVLEAQDPWADPARAENLLALLPNKALSDSLRTKWESSPGRSSTSKWADIDAVAKSGQVKNLDSKQLLEAKQDIVLEYTYPRLDIEVSKKLNHLLKSPFVVHPGTGRVCVPIDLEKLDDFDPLEVPTVQGLLAEIDSWKPVDGEPAPQDWEKTSLRPYIEKFRTFVLALMKGERDPKVKREREDEGMEF